ncbi:MAG: sulfotransferase [Pseudomonadota bacterium]
MQADAGRMPRRYHFISGLPRSGSTLTAGILRQNPRFHAGMSSPIAGLFEGMISQVSAGTELASTVTQEQRRRLLRGLFDSYYADYPEEIIFDTNRAWTAKLPALMQVFPDAKVICLVRDVSWIMDSMERQFRKDPFEHTRLFHSPGERATVYTRTEAMAAANRLIGYPWHALREACYSDYADRIVIVDYDLITHRPAEVFKLIYDFLGEPAYPHDFGNVEYDAPEFDTHLGLDGLHRVQGAVEPRPRATVLPPDLFEKYAKLAFWRDLPNSRANRIVVQQTVDQDTQSMPGPPTTIEAE